MLSAETKSQIEGLIQKNRVVLFMKGNKHFPQCGFSAQVVQILKEVGVPFDGVNVLQDAALRDGIKEFTQWPTIPQLYVDGQFVGGCDIVKDLYAQGELQKLLGAEAEDVPAPVIHVHERAAKAFRDADDGSGDLLRLEVSSDFKYELYFGPKKAGDFEVKAGGLTILVDRASAKRANGITIEWVETADGGAFRIDNPAEPPSVKPLSVTELKAWLDRGDKLEIFDVRGDDERARAKIDAAKKFDESAEAYVRTLPKSTTIVMQCHHGGRSRRAAERLVAEGFTRVYNLEGGIDAWSVKVDPKVARY
ncbi:MAG: Grx4 family monothiol glutaredoxin [Myxococcales bacterium]|jgi:monothiol glutaredoxin|nr:Grx4 family monothiol glutaredoxin [Myxococcales bacterium]